MTGITNPAEEYFKDGLWAWNGTAWVKVTVDAGGRLEVVVGGGDYVCVRDKKAQNTTGGTFTSGAWRTRDINDEQADAGALCSIAANQITLAAGTYRCLISAPAAWCNRHQARLYNITDTAVILAGTSEYSTNTLADLVTTRSFIVGRFTLAAAKVLEVQHQCQTTRVTYGLGVASNFTDEIYTVAEFWREPG